MVISIIIAHCHLQAKCQLHIVQTSYIERIKLFLFAPYKKHLITVELSRSVWENLDLGRVYSLHSVCAHDLSQDSPVRLIRATCR